MRIDQPADTIITEKRTSPTSAIEEDPDVAMSSGTAESDGGPVRSEPVPVVADTEHC